VVRISSIYKDKRMQLDLFEDNRANILLNIADEYLREGEFAKALSTCEQVREEYPENRQAVKLCELIQMWRSIISGLNPSSCTPQQLEETLTTLESVIHPPLRTAVMEILVEYLRTVPESDYIFLPPHFHLGHLLLRLGRFAEAATSFRSALSSPDLERGRFLAWSADAMTLGGNGEDATSMYLQAFLDDPLTVDIASVKHPAILNLYQHCCHNADSIEDDNIVAWLPVWGWLQGLFPLPLHHPPLFDELEVQLADKAAPTPRLWYSALTLAEYLRTIHINNVQMPAVRRLMKRLNEDMFECYMQKIRRTR
jgi:tetratricopeptide (TPR) repeat protein